MNEGFPSDASPRTSKGALRTMLASLRDRLRRPLWPAASRLFAERWAKRVLELAPIRATVESIEGDATEAIRTRHISLSNGHWACDVRVRPFVARDERGRLIEIPASIDAQPDMRVRVGSTVEIVGDLRVRPDSYRGERFALTGHAAVRAP